MNATADTTKLHPSLETIESQLFSPSDALVQRWIKKDPTLNPETVAELEASELAIAKRDALLSLENIELPEPLTEYNAVPSVVPPRIIEMISNRVDTQNRFKDVDDSAAGQIRLVDRAIGPDGKDLGWDMNYPLAVLLVHETDVRDIWYGFVVSGETDYACDQDVLLEKCDEPYDPLVGMVQIWNPVHIYVKSTGRVLAQLSSSRLGVVMTTFTDFLTEEPSTCSAQPGALMSRVTSEGDAILTGTPMGDDEVDPRIRYQECYFAVAEFVKDIARIAQDEDE